MAERDPKTGRFPKGNGAGGPGWGGPAKGASRAKLLEPQGDPESDAIRALIRDPKNEEAKRPLRELAYGVWVEVCKDQQHPQRVVAAEKLMNRIDGMPKQQTDITSGGERIGYVIEAPAEAPDADAWAAQHRPH